MSETIQLSVEAASSVLRRISEASANLAMARTLLGAAGGLETRLGREVIRLDNEVNGLVRQIQPSLLLKS